MFVGIFEGYLFECLKDFLPSDSPGKRDFLKEVRLKLRNFGPRN